MSDDKQFDKQETPHKFWTEQAARFDDIWPLIADLCRYRSYSAWLADECDRLTAEVKSLSSATVPKFALDSQIEITNQERASKERAEMLLRTERDIIIEQCAVAAEKRFSKATAHHTVSAIAAAIRALKQTKYVGEKK